MEGSEREYRQGNHEEGMGMRERERERALRKRERMKSTSKGEREREREGGGGRERESGRESESTTNPFLSPVLEAPPPPPHTTVLRSTQHTQYGGMHKGWREDAISPISLLAFFLFSNL